MNTAITNLIHLHYTEGSPLQTIPWTMKVKTFKIIVQDILLLQNLIHYFDVFSQAKAFHRGTISIDTPEIRSSLKPFSNHTNEYFSNTQSSVEAIQGSLRKSHNSA